MDVTFVRIKIYVLKVPSDYEIKEIKGDDE